MASHSGLPLIPQPLKRFSITRNDLASLQNRSLDLTSFMMDSALR
jgi:hypothetical protein